MMWQRVLFVLAAIIAPWTLAQARSPSRDDAMRAAIHPVATSAAMQSWLARVPVTRVFPADFAAGQSVNGGNTFRRALQGPV